jgi:hypothetical protein
MQTTARDPLGYYMVGFTRGKSPAQAREIATIQRTLCDQANDSDGVAFWNQVLAFLAITAA